ncbi:hypothetical protein [Adhaeribacter rhizoryzae]|uniref:hypothetical protein n=1 Tax=Adhaeribacter rhizoryzae TaxID=2607907 RepID=UPI001CC20C62|nr:hypothetical protein [Adhaeribacter rhizoryzae]
MAWQLAQLFLNNVAPACTCASPPAVAAPAVCPSWLTEASSPCAKEEKTVKKVRSRVSKNGYNLFDLQLIIA